ncbi:MAG: histidine kinase [Saprospiraceae bacterium]|nr:histidine kinase [Saprospiraceae bacterium]
MLEAQTYITHMFLFLLLIFIVCGYYLAPYMTHVPTSQVHNINKGQFFTLFSTAALPSTVGSMTLAMSLKLGKNWLNAEKKRLVLEKENVETELKYLKSQINPHFLFNTINSIFVLIDKNPDQARESLASFSEMLRYQLYECNDLEILLSKDLQFLENFIALETLRLNENQTELLFEINHDTAKDLKISAFMLLPFVENAFKHVSKGKTQQNYIKMYLAVNEANNLEMTIENSKNKEMNSDNVGIGLKNVQRRLNLIYPEKHDLKIESGEINYKIILNIQL